MAGGYYDYEVGACFPDEGGGAPDAGSPDAGPGFPHMEKPDSVPEECWSETLGTDWDCMNRDTLEKLLEELLDYLFGESD